MVYTETYVEHMRSERNHIRQSNPQDPRLRLPNHIITPLAKYTRKAEKDALQSQQSQPQVPNAKPSPIPGLTQGEPSTSVEDGQAPNHGQVMD